MKTSGYGIKRGGRRMADIVDGAFARSLGLMAKRGTPQLVGVVGIYREAEPIRSVIAELRHSRHVVIPRLGSMGDIPPALAGETAQGNLTAGKFQNLNVLIDGFADLDWLVIIDDDVTVPRGFLDAAIELCQRLDLALAQPAQSRFSNANWPLTKQRLLTVARETHFVEIGPVTLIRGDALRLLAPFPEDLRYGWGLDFRWARQMLDAGLRMGVLDILAVEHSSRKVASTYSWDAAQNEGREFLSTVPHVPNDVAKGDGVRTHRWIPRAS